jgi:hypothetical protein
MDVYALRHAFPLQQFKIFHCGFVVEQSSGELQGLQNLQ